MNTKNKTVNPIGANYSKGIHAVTNTRTEQTKGDARPEKARNYMAVDQYGQTYHNLGAHPRKALMERLCAKHCSKMYVGDGIHIGYVIAGQWLSVYEVKPMHEIAGGK